MKNVNFREAQAVGSICLTVAIVIAMMIVKNWDDIAFGFKSCLQAIGF